MPFNYGRLQKWSRKIREEKGNRCALCGGVPDGTYIKRIEVHHIVPINSRIDIMYDERNGIPLCHKCHMMAHGNRHYLNINNFPKEKEKIRNCLDQHGWTYPADPPLLVI